MERLGGLSSPRPSQELAGHSPPPPQAPRIGREPLYFALRANDLDAVRAALDADPFPWGLLLRRCDVPPVLAALRFGCSLPVMRLLLQHGAEVDATDRLGKTALMALAHAGPRPPQQAALPWALRPLEGVADGPSTSSVWPSASANPAALLFLKQGLPGTGRLDPDPPEPLKLSEPGRCAFAALLLSFGADASLHDELGLTAANHAEAAGLHQLTDLLRHWGGKERQALRTLRTERHAGPCHGSCALCVLAVVVHGVEEMLAPSTFG